MPHGYQMPPPGSDKRQRTCISVADVDAAQQALSAAQHPRAGMQRELGMDVLRVAEGHYREEERAAQNVEEAINVLTRVRLAMQMHALQHPEAYHPAMKQEPGAQRRFAQFDGKHLPKYLVAPPTAPLRPSAGMIPQPGLPLSSSRGSTSSAAIELAREHLLLAQAPPNLPKYLVAPPTAPLRPSAGMIPQPGLPLSSSRGSTSSAAIELAREHLLLAQAPPNLHAEYVSRPDSVEQQSTSTESTALLSRAPQDLERPAAGLLQVPALDALVPPVSAIAESVAKALGY